MLPPTHEITLEIIKTGLSLIILAFGWIIGQRIIATWELRKMRHKLDVAAAERFHLLYGELKEVGRLWRSAKIPKGNPVTPPSDLQWSLLRRKKINRSVDASTVWF